MNLWEYPILLVAGLLAGIINAVVGSGSLITFPALLALGYPPVIANVTNNLGVLPASIVGAIAARKELSGQMRRLGKLMIFSAVGGLIGAALLLVLPAGAFRAVVPFLICLALVLVIFGPAIRRRIDARQSAADSPARRDTAARISAGATGIYGGYFGAAQGVLLISLLSLTLREGLARTNAYKNALTAVANTAAAVVFVVVSHVAWLPAITIAIGASAGGWIGGRIGNRLPPTVYRATIVVIGVAALVYFFVS